MPSPNFQDFREELLNVGRVKIVSSFYCDPSIEQRPATDEDRNIRTLNNHKDWREILLILKGECEFMLNGNIYRGVKDTAFLIDRGEVHQDYYPRNTPPGHHLWIYITPEVMIHSLLSISDGEFHELNKLSHYHPHTPHDREILLAAWEKNRKNGGRVEYLTEMSLLLALRAAMTAQIYNDAVNCRDYNTKDHNRLKIQNIMEYIDAQCGRDCSIVVLTRLAGCSRSNFIRNFQRYAGCSVLEYVDRQRIHCCKSMMKANNMKWQSVPLKICAEKLGFSSAQSFARWRTKHAKELGEVEPE